MPIKPTRPERPDPKQFFRQMFGAAMQVGDGNRAAKRKFSQTVGAFTAGLRREAEAAVQEFEAHVQQVRRSLPPMTVRVLPTGNLEWTDEPAARSRLAALRAAGFQELGRFRLDAIPNYTLVGFIHPEKAVQAEVTRTGDATVLELSSRYTDGTGFASLDVAAKPGQPVPPWASIRRRPELAPDELIKDFLESRPQEGLVPVTPETFASRIEGTFSRVQCWRAERGGFTEAELRQMHGLGDDPESRAQAEMLRHDHAQRWLCNWLAARPDAGVRLADVLDTLVIVYEEMSADFVANAWWCGTGDFGLRSTEFALGKPIEVFREINRRRGEPLRLVCRKPPPFAADFYLPNPRPQPTRKASALVRAIEAGLAKNDLRGALFDVRDSQIKSDRDAVAICDALRGLSAGATADFARQVQALTRLFQQVPNLKSAAAVRLTREGLPLLASRFDELRGLRKDSAAGSAGLLILQTLARFETAAGTDKVIAAARAGFERDGLGWTGVFSRYRPGHPHLQRLFAALSAPPPPGGIAGTLLTVANTLLLSGATLKHPFDSPAGRKRLLAWILDPDPENSGAAHTATAAIPFLGKTGRKDLLTAAGKHPDLGVCLEAAWAAAKLGQKAGLRALIRHCGHWRSTSAAQQYLRELGREELIPASTRETSFAALTQMSDWLAHPNELGRTPDELEIVDHRELAWPPERKKKPLWVIRYRVRALAGGESGGKDETGCGLVGSITFCLFSVNLALRPAEDVYAVHCCWELEQRDLFSEDAADAQEASEHKALLDQWRGEPLQAPVVTRVAKLSKSLRYPQRVVGLARAKLNGRNGCAILDGVRSGWHPTPRLKVAEVESYESLLLRAHVGRRLLGL